MFAIKSGTSRCINHLSSIPTNCHSLPFIAIYCHLLPFIAIYCHLLPFIAIHCHLLPQAAQSHLSNIDHLRHIAGGPSRQSSAASDAQFGAEDGARATGGETGGA
jgi:hypothetical protein